MEFGHSGPCYVAACDGKLHEVLALAFRGGTMLRPMNRPAGFAAPPRLRFGLLLLVGGALLLTVAAARLRGTRTEPKDAAPAGTPAR